MALSCVYRTGQRFGAGHLSDVLIGKTTERVEKFNHHALSTFGIGKELNAAQWSSVYRQLVASGILESDIEAYGGLKLTETARPILRGEQSVWLRRDADPAIHKAGRKAQRAERTAQGNNRSREPFAGANDDPLWLALKAKRLALAREQGVPPYVIFHDSTLLEILSQRPATLDDLARVSGVGQAKLARYGESFLGVLKDAAHFDK
jgi:ATP-dependent DNA helicase RecQ